MDADVSSRLHCSFHYALGQRFVRAALGACSRGEFYENSGVFCLWRIVALAVDLRTKPALAEIRRLENVSARCPQLAFVLRQIKSALLKQIGSQEE